MSDYESADECQTALTSSLSQLYAFKLNQTYKKTWNDPFFAVTYSLGSPVNDAWFYCYQWFTNFYDVYEKKYDSFVDFGDLYLSFIFNMLGNSL